LAIAGLEHFDFGGLCVTGRRVLTAAVLLPVVVGLVWWGPTWLVAAVVGLVTLLALDEFFGLAERAGMAGYPRWTLACSLWILYEQWVATTVTALPLAGKYSLVRASGRLEMPLDLVLLGFAVGAACIAIASRRPLGDLLPALSASAAGLLFVSLPLSYLVRLHGAEHLGRQLLLFALGLVWLGDTLAYFAGRSFGRLPLAPSLSPNKTWEGAAANLAGSLLAAMLFAWWLKVESLQLLAMATLANLAGQVGDLVESAYKRSAGAKDSGTLLPGHGGMLDRIDSLIFAAPVAWCYFWFIMGGRI
jgi:phosphatidate cytidylyltransferase